MTQTASNRNQQASGCPVKNFDFTQIKPVGSWIDTYDELRAETPVFWNEFGPGFWTAVDHNSALEVFQNPEVFSSSVVTPLDPDPAYRWIPEMLDGDEHLQWRRQLGPLFSPKAMERLEPKIRQRAAELIDEILAKNNSSCDFMIEFAQLYPTSIFLELMGLPVDELDQFMEWEHAILRPSADDLEVRQQDQAMAMMAIMQRFAEVITERRVEPREDIISAAIDFEIDGAPVSDQDLLSFCLLMFIAGLDTVSVTLGWSIWHLATHPDDRTRIAGDPDLISSAIEEFLRAYAIVIPARKVMQDTVVGGCPMKAGDMVALPLNAATRDDAVFPEATIVDIERAPNNHIAFGAGPHRCLGSHLARRELRIALEEWHKRLPDYRIVPGADIVETGAQLGLVSLPIEWDRA